MGKDLIASQVFQILILFCLYYLVGFSIRFIFLCFHKTEWNDKLYIIFRIVYPNLIKVVLLSVLVGLIFLWLPTLLGIIPTSIFSKIGTFISSFSFSILVSSIQGWILIQGFSVIFKYQSTKNVDSIVQEKLPNSTQYTIFFLGFVFILSVFLDFLLTFFFFPLTS
jgi:hypothetical protein